MIPAMQRTNRGVHRDASAHMFQVGQAVRVKRGFGKLTSAPSDVYRITGTLPPRENSPQYRIRNQDERHERVTTQDNLEPVDIPADGNRATLIERTFGHGKGTETQQPRNPEAQAGKDSA